MAMSFDWKIPSPHQRTVCVNHLRLESVGGSEEASVKRVGYPILNVGVYRDRQEEQEDRNGDDSEDHEGSSWNFEQVKKIVYSALLKWMWRMPSSNKSSQSLCGRECIAWHPKYLTLAAISSDRILIYNEKSLQEGKSHDEELRPKVNTKYFCVSYRPNSPGDIAGGSDSGVHLFTKSLPQLSGGLAHDQCAYHMRRLGTGHIDCLVWHPSGNLLAAAGSTLSGFTVWDVNLGRGVRIAHFLERVNLLRLSPCVAYIASASQDGMFYLWEVRNWNVKSWDCQKLGHVVAAQWDPRSRYIVLAFGKNHKLTTVHITQDPPALDTSWIALDINQICPQTDNICDGEGSDKGCVDWMTWNDDGSRMAIALKAPHPAAECVALFDTTMSGSLNALFIGYARIFQRPAAGESRLAATYMKFHRKSKTEDILAVRQGRLVSFLSILRKESRLF